MIPYKLVLTVTRISYRDKKNLRNYVIIPYILLYFSLHKNTLQARGYNLLIHTLVPITP